MWPSNESRALCTIKHMQICRYKKVKERSVDQKCHHDEHSSPNRSQLTNSDYCTLLNYTGHCFIIILSSLLLSFQTQTHSTTEIDSPHFTPSKQDPLTALGCAGIMKRAGGDLWRLWSYNKWNGKVLLRRRNQNEIVARSWNIEAIQRPR